MSLLRIDVARDINPATLPPPARGAHPNLDAFNEATRMSDAELVSALRDLLGAELVAYLARSRKQAVSDSGPKVAVRLPIRQTKNVCESPTARPG